MKKTIKNKVIVMLALSVSATSYADSWTPELNIDDVQFLQTSSNSNYTAIFLDADFHTCAGSNKHRGHAVSSRIGVDQLKTINAVLLAAQLADRTVSLRIKTQPAGCGPSGTSSIVDIVGIKLGN